MNLALTRPRQAGATLSHPMGEGLGEGRGCRFMGTMRELVRGILTMNLGRAELRLGLDARQRVPTRFRGSMRE
jgi:hypothetical protein